MTIATPFSATEDAFAGSMVALMANAVVTLASGAASGQQLPAVFSQPVADGLGGARLMGRQPTVLVPTAGLVPDVQQGSALQVLYRGAATPWLVERRTDAPEAGDTLLDLERPA
jgi:hypothetical protein